MPHLFIHSSVDRYLGGFQFLAPLESAAFLHKSFERNIYAFLLSILLKKEITSS